MYLLSFYSVPLFTPKLILKVLDTDHIKYIYFLNISFIAVCFIFNELIY